jgi:hypothetical protein
MVLTTGRASANCAAACNPRRACSGYEGRVRFPGWCRSARPSRLPLHPRIRFPRCTALAAAASCCTTEPCRRARRCSTRCAFSPASSDSLRSLRASQDGALSRSDLDRHLQTSREGECHRAEAVLRVGDEREIGLVSWSRGHRVVGDEHGSLPQMGRYVR